MPSRWACERPPQGSCASQRFPGLNEALAPVLAQFSEAYPEVAVCVHPAPRYIDIEAEHFDIAVRATTRLATAVELTMMRGSFSRREAEEPRVEAYAHSSTDPLQGREHERPERRERLGGVR